MGGSRKIRVDTVPAAQPMEYHGSLCDMILALWTGFVKRDVICCPVHGVGENQKTNGPGECLRTSGAIADDVCHTQISGISTLALAFRAGAYWTLCIRPLRHLPALCAGEKRCLDFDGFKLVIWL